jgi:hypothetical protein
MHRSALTPVMALQTSDQACAAAQHENQGEQVYNEPRQHLVNALVCAQPCHHGRSIMGVRRQQALFVRLPIVFGGSRTCEWRQCNVYRIVVEE